MTVEEIEIVVTAKVEEALKEFQKIIPAIKQSMKQAQDAFSKVDTKAMTNKLHQAVNFMKKKMEDFKKSSENSEVAIKVNNKDAQKQITQIEKEIDSLQKKITSRQLKLDVTNNALDKIRYDTNQSVIKEIPEAGNKRIKQETYRKLDNNTNYQSLVKQSDKLYNEIDKFNTLLNSAKSKMAELEQQTSKTSTTQSELGSFFGTFKKKIEQVKPSISKINNSFKELPKTTQNITNNIKGMSAGIRNGLGHVFKYAMALFSLRGAYSVLSSCAQSWLSSQNAGAKQLSANINYMKYAMGSAFAPVIQYVTGLIYQLMKAIQSVVYALFRVNIFAKASASSYASMAGSAKKAKNETKQLAGVHDEINNVQSNDSSDNGSGGGMSPSFDLSGMDNQMSALSQKLYDFFKPLVDSWNKYGSQVKEAFKNAVNGVGQAISAIWNSVETLFTNGTIYSIIANILNSIGQIGTAWANAWNNDDNGTEIIQGIANMINDITGAILNLVSSTGFQSFLDGVLSAFSGIVQFIEPIVSGFSEMAEKILEIVLSSIGDVLKTVGDALQTIVQNKTVAEILKAVGGAIAIVVGAITLWNVVQAILNGLMGLFAIVTSPITLVILAIVAAITVAILIFKNWGKISEWLGQKFNEARENINTAFQNIGKWFDDRKNDITKAFANIGNWFSSKFQEAYNGITRVFSNIGNFFSGIGQKIGDAIGGAVKSGINGVISLIEKTINKAINLINGAIGIINLIPGVNINEIGKLNLPRLAKGGVLTEATTVLAGEYSGAKTNPEIVTPQNIMRDTFEDVLSNYSGSNNDRPIYLTVNVGNQKLGQILLEDLRDRTRRTGKDIEALVGG